MSNQTNKKPRIDTGQYDAKALFEQLVAEDPTSITARTLKHLYNDGPSDQLNMHRAIAVAEFMYKKVETLTAPHIPGMRLDNKVDYDTPAHSKLLSPRERAALLKATREVTGLTGKPAGKEWAGITAVTAAGLMFLAGGVSSVATGIQKTQERFENRNTPAHKQSEYIKEQSAAVQGDLNNTANGSDEYVKSLQDGQKRIAEIIELMQQPNNKEALEQYRQKELETAATNLPIFGGLGLALVGILLLAGGYSGATEPRKKLFEEAKEQLTIKDEPTRA